MDSLSQHRAYLQQEWQALRATPLSSRRARLVAALADAYVDRLFAATPDAEDILDFRAAAGARFPALGMIMAFCAGRVQLITEAVAVPIEDYGSLAVEDFMVSLYNGHTVQRMRLVTTIGQQDDLLGTLAQALEDLDQIGFLKDF